MKENIPTEWFYPGYFFTYYGDVYFGSAGFCSDDEHCFFIIQNDRRNEFNKLSTSEKTREKCKAYGWEIRDHRIIRQYHKSDEKAPLGGENQYVQHGRNWNAKYKRMFLFGAGASAFCTFGDKFPNIRASKLRVPLATEIFDQNLESIYKRFPGASEIIPDYLINQGDIEKCLEDEWQIIKRSYCPELLYRHINTVYYLQDLFRIVSQNAIDFHSSNNLYALFADKLLKHYSGKNEKFVITSFNYDFILDHFISQKFRAPFKDLNSYFNYDLPYLFIKPHGSCNWGWKLNTEKINSIGRTGIAGLLFEQKIDLHSLFYTYLGDIKENLAENSWGFEMELHPDNLGHHTMNKSRIEIMEQGQRYYPAMLLPYKDKDEFVMPYDHQIALKSILGEVEELYLIGWKGNEKVFNRYFNFHSQNLKKVVIVNPEEVSESTVSNNLKDYPKIAGIKPQVHKDFEDFVLKEMDKIFIN